MSRYNLALRPQQAIPRDLKLGVQLKPAAAGVGATVFETQTVVTPAPKKLLLTGPFQIGGVFASVGSPTTAEFYVMTTALLTEEVEITITSSDPTIAEAVQPVATLIGVGFYARYDFSLLIHQGGSFGLTVSAEGWESDTISVIANALAMGQNVFAAAEAIVAADTFNENQGSLYPISNVCATREVGEPNHAGADGEHSLWWKITPSANGTLSVDTRSCVGGFDTVIGVYTGASVGALTEIASNDDLSGSDRRSEILGISVSAGTTYYIAVAMFNNTSGVGEVRLHYQLDVPSV